MKLITIGNYKTQKGEKLGYLTGILHLAPASLSGFNVCPNSSEGCRKACLNTAGKGRYSNVQIARKNRTLRFFNEREQFMADLMHDVATIARRAKKNGMTPAIRPNGTSDILTLGVAVAKAFPEIQVYDYTKNAKTFDKALPANYHLTFSRSETNEGECLKLLKKGFNVAMVFDRLPETYKGFKVVSGDDTDLRFLDEKGVIVGLSAKGRAKHDKTNFVIRTQKT